MTSDPSIYSTGGIESPIEPLVASQLNYRMIDPVGKPNHAREPQISVGSENAKELVIRWLRQPHSAPATFPTDPSEWPALVAFIENAGLAGIVLERAASTRDELPQWAMERLRPAAARTAADNLHAMHHTEPLIGAFHRGGVPVMLLKGAALITTVYQRPDLRPMSDVDLLIRPDDAERAAELLLREGCRPGFALLSDDFFPKYYYETEWIIPSPRPVRLDVHARPFRPLRISRTMPDDAFWKDPRRTRIGATDVWVPRLEFLFIHLAAHLAFHGCTRLLWMYDLKRFSEVHGTTLDWRLIVESSRRWRLSVAVHRGVQCAAEMLGPICPPEVLKNLAAQPGSWRDRLSLARAPHDAEAPLLHVLCNLLCTPGVAFRLGYLRALLLPGRGHLAGLYKRRHAGWVAVAHIWRCLRVIGRVFYSPLVASLHFVGRLYRPGLGNA